MQSFLTKISNESVAFNIMTYLLLALGFLVAIVMNMLAHILSLPLMHQYVVVVCAVTMSTGALCHYFLKRADSYITRPGDNYSRDERASFLDYKSKLDKHDPNKIVVGSMNAIIILAFLWVLIDSVNQTYGTGSPVVVTAAFLFVAALVVFVLAKPLAEYGWRQK